MPNPINPTPFRSKLSKENVKILLMFHDKVIGHSGNLQIPIRPMKVQYFDDDGIFYDCKKQMSSKFTIVEMYGRRKQERYRLQTEFGDKIWLIKDEKGFIVKFKDAKVNFTYAKRRKSMDSFIQAFESFHLDQPPETEQEIDQKIDESDQSQQIHQGQTIRRNQIITQFDQFDRFEQFDQLNGKGTDYKNIVLSNGNQDIIMSDGNQTPSPKRPSPITDSSSISSASEFSLRSPSDQSFTSNESRETTPKTKRTPGPHSIASPCPSPSYDYPTIKLDQYLH